VRPDLPGLGRSRIPAGFEWSLPSLAAYVAHVMDKAGVDSAHIIGAKAGGAIAMQFAADYPARTRTLSVVHVPVVTSSAAARFSVLNPKEQGARLGSAASKEMVEYWEKMFATASEITSKGLLTAVYGSDFARDGVLQRIKAPTLLMTGGSGPGAIGREGAAIPNAHSQFAAGGRAQRRLPYCRRECRRVRRQRPRLHQGGEAQGLAGRIVIGGAKRDSKGV
jgi:pimeloyl-ACP methyl ester carboxylesterase